MQTSAEKVTVLHLYSFGAFVRACLVICDLMEIFQVLTTKVEEEEKVNHCTTHCTASQTLPPLQQQKKNINKNIKTVKMESGRGPHIMTESPESSHWDTYHPTAFILHASSYYPIILFKDPKNKYSVSKYTVFNIKII